MPILGSFILPHPPLIIPEIGKGQETEIQNTIDAYRLCAEQIAALKPDTIIVTTPHSIMYQDYFHLSPSRHANGDFRRFRAKQVQIKVDYDTEFVTVLTKQADAIGIPAGTLGERDSSLDHGTMIPLYFLKQYNLDYHLVRIGLSGLPLDEHYRLGMCIADTANQLNRNVVFIASGDLSHKLLTEGSYGFAQEGVDFDKQVTEAMNNGDFLTFLQFQQEFLEKAAECGLRSFVIMAGAMDGQEVKSKLLSYEGPFGVGYGVASFFPIGINKNRAFLDQYLIMEKTKLEQQRNNESPYVKLARYTLEYYLEHAKLPLLPDDIPDHFQTEKTGVFVSLKKKGALRGCIGTILPTTESIAEEIRQNAISAGTNDPRFEPVNIHELPDLEYSVDILTAPEPISSPEALDPAKYGVIVTQGNKRGLLLPDLPGIETVEDQIRIAGEKAGIREGTAISLSRFEVVRYR